MYMVSYYTALIPVVEMLSFEGFGTKNVINSCLVERTKVCETHNVEKEKTNISGL
jgi:hypothetical protein